MSHDNPRAFGDPSSISLDSSDRDTLARLLSRLFEPDCVAADDRLDSGARADLAKWLYDQRRRRDQFLPPELFGEPAWDILLLLYWGQHSQRRLSISAVCASAGAPTTTALRYIEHLSRSGLISKRPHPTDRRVSWLSLSDEAERKIGAYLERIANAPALPLSFVNPA